MPRSSRQIGGDYYSQMRIQPWDAMEEWLTVDQMRGYLLGSAIAYLARFNVTDPGKGGIIDICKAQHFLDRLVEVVAERCDDGDDTKVPTDFRKTDFVPGPAQPDEFPLPEPGSEHEIVAPLDVIAACDVPDTTKDPAAPEIRGLNIQMLADSYAKRGFKSSEIADRLNHTGFLRPDGKPWTAYQIAMMLADVTHPTCSDGGD